MNVVEFSQAIRNEAISNRQIWCFRKRVRTLNEGLKERIFEVVLPFMAGVPLSGVRPLIQTREGGGRPAD